MAIFYMGAFASGNNDGTTPLDCWDTTSFNTQHAAVVKPGDTVYFMDSITVGAGSTHLLTIGVSGGASNRITFRGDYPGRACVFDGTGIRVSCIYTNGNSNFIFKNFTIKNFEKRGLYLQDAGANPANILNITVNGVSFYNIGNFYEFSTSIHIRGSDVTVLNSYFDGCGDDHISAQGARLVVHDCRFRRQSLMGATGDCIAINTICDGYRFYNNYFDHSDIDSKQCVVVTPLTTEHPKGHIYNNTFIGPVGAVVHNNIYCENGSARIYKNTFINGNRGIYCINSSTGQHRIFGNIFKGHTEAGVATGFGNLTTNIIVANNYFENTGKGVDGNTNSVNVKSYNNIFKNCTIGVYKYVTGQVESHNCFHGCTDNVMLLTTPETISISSFIADPLINDDYTLSLSSPCIDAGTDWYGSTYPDGFDGNPIYKDVGPIQSRNNALHPKNLINSTNPAHTFSKQLIYTADEINESIEKIGNIESAIPLLKYRVERTPEDYGASGNGIDDDSVAFLNAVTACSKFGYKLISEAGKTYRLATNKTLSRSTHKWLDVDLGGATLLFDNASFKFSGPGAYLTTDLTAEVAKGQNYVDLLNVTGIIPGDMLNIVTPVKSGPERAETVHYYIVNAISGNRVYLTGPTVADITILQITDSGGTGDINSFTVNLYHLFEPVSWRNTNISITDSTGVIAGALDFSGCKALWLDNLKVDGNCRTQIGIRQNGIYFVSRCHFNNFGYTNDTGASLPSGTPYGYAITAEKNWMGHTVDCNANYGHYAFNDNYGQMHSHYLRCMIGRAAAGFYCGNSTWYITYESCYTLSDIGFYVNSTYINLKDCHAFANNAVLSISSITQQVTIDNCEFEGLSATSDLITMNTGYTSSNRNPKSVNPGSVSAGVPVKWEMKNSSLSSKLTNKKWAFGIDNVNTDSILIIVNNTFYNVLDWSSSGCFHAKTKILDNLFHGTTTGQFILAPSVYPVSAGAEWVIENNKVYLDGALSLGAMLYLNAPSSNFTLTLRRNSLHMPSAAGLVRLNNAGTCNIAYCEFNDTNANITYINTASPTTLNITYQYNNISQGVTNNSATGLTVTKQAQNIDRTV